MVQLTSYCLACDTQAFMHGAGIFQVLAVLQDVEEASPHTLSPSLLPSIRYLFLECAAGTCSSMEQYCSTQMPCTKPYTVSQLVYCSVEMQHLT